jgi:hypothetical protein
LVIGHYSDRRGNYSSLVGSNIAKMADALVSLLTAINEYTDVGYLPLAVLVLAHHIRPTS